MNDYNLVTWYKDNLSRFEGEDREAIEYMFKELLRLEGLLGKEGD